jgi:hypothetical protein
MIIFFVNNRFVRQAEAKMILVTRIPELGHKKGYQIRCPITASF